MGNNYRAILHLSRVSAINNLRYQNWIISYNIDTYIIFEIRDYGLMILTSTGLTNLVHLYN